MRNASFRTDSSTKTGSRISYTIFPLNLPHYPLPLFVPTISFRFNTRKPVVYGLDSVPLPSRPSRTPLVSTRLDSAPASLTEAFWFLALDAARSKAWADFFFSLQNGRHIFDWLLICVSYLVLVAARSGQDVPPPTYFS